MTNPKIQEYIEQCKKQGLENQKIKESLISAGWPEKDVDEAFDSQTTNEPKNPNPEKTNSQQQSNITEEPKKTLETNTKKTKNKTKKILIIALIILIIAGGAFAGYTFYFKKLLAKKAIQEALNNIDKVETYHYFLNAEIILDLSDFNEVIGSKNEIPLLASIMPIAQKEEQKEGGQKINIRMEGDVSLSEARHSSLIFANTNDSESIEIEMRGIDKTFYFKVKELPTIEGFDFSTLFSDEWIEINPEDYKGLAKGRVDEELIEGDLTEKEKEELKSIVKNSFKIIKVSNEEVNDIECYYSKIKIDMEELMKATQHYGDSFFDEEDKAKMKEEWEGSEDPEIELWVGKTNKIIRQAKINFSMTGEDVTIKIDGEISKVNVPVKIEKPENPQNIEEFLNFFMNRAHQVQSGTQESQTPYLESIEQKQRDVRRISDLRQVALALEMYYDNNTSTGYPGTDDTESWSALERALEAGGYMKQVPSDPGTGSYFYYPGNNNTTYILGATLENNDNTVLRTDVDYANIKGVAVPSGACNDTSGNPQYCIQP
ncbi:MAG: hypothetical protein GF387_02505 [Candidatus Portnoybacteria bacterium]|nr:hypothetical protein [Candidatus Portnoybacteria bacterium]